MEHYEDKTMEYLLNDPTADEFAAKRDLAAGFPIVYCDEDYPETMKDNNLMIEEHPNGDRFIVAINIDTRELTKVRQIPPFRRMG
ncbi:hypothetical protein [Geofilum rhodophaeum]|uniref:hypothetical protein n=1 Tax=Geofilum rhodophaeum TaxID=1965019 RepID=UPI000B5224E5|nr:hypothetical protein [Geofilum rhodophaeum]